MPALVAGIHVFIAALLEDVDGRDISAKARFALSPGYDDASEWCVYAHL